MRQARRAGARALEVQSTRRADVHPAKARHRAQQVGQTAAHCGAQRIVGAINAGRAAAEHRVRGNAGVAVQRPCPAAELDRAVAGIVRIGVGAASRQIERSACDVDRRNMAGGPAVVERDIDGGKRRGAGLAEGAKVAHRPRGAGVALVADREASVQRLIGEGRADLDVQRRRVVQQNRLALRRLRAGPEQFQRPIVQREIIVLAAEGRAALRNRRSAAALRPGGSEGGGPRHRQRPGPG